MPIATSSTIDRSPALGAAAVWRVDVGSADHAQARLIVHARAQAALAECLRAPAERVRIAHRRGAPPETNVPGWSLSLSYARSLALIAIGRGIRVGVDLVALGDLGETANLARDYLCGMRIASPLDLAAAWAEREATSKCLGEPLIEGARSSVRPRVEAIEVPSGWVARLASLPSA